jgi:hypothetical protein
MYHSEPNKASPETPGIRIKLLKEKYKSIDGAKKRATFENAVAKSEYKRGDSAKIYKYRIIRQVGESYYRVECYV